jgi:hypothetical protein
MASSTLIRLVGSKFFQRQAGIEANPKSRLGAPRLPTRTTHPAHLSTDPLSPGVSAWRRTQRPRRRYAQPDSRWRAASDFSLRASATDDLVVAGKPLPYSANQARRNSGPSAVSTTPANRRRLRSPRRVIFLVLNEDRFESFPRPKVRRVDFSQARGVPI